MTQYLSISTLHIKAVCAKCGSEMKSLFDDDEGPIKSQSNNDGSTSISLRIPLCSNCYGEFFAMQAVIARAVKAQENKDA